MATVGHTFVGLSLGGLCRDKDRNHAMPYIWTGLVVLLAHLVDLVEWAVTLVTPSTRDNHPLTHSPLLAGGLVVLVWVVLRLATTLRSVWGYLIVALAILSHLVLDHPQVRRLVADASGIMPHDELPRLRETVLAEVWFYGAFLVVALLFRARREPGTPRAGRYACGALGLIAVGAAATRHVALWAPAYCLALIHAGLLLRRNLKPQLAWSLVPLVPLFAFVGVEAAAAVLVRQAESLRKDGNFAQAVGFYQRALDIPTRTAAVRTYVNLAMCYEALDRPAEAEATLLRGRAHTYGNVWADFWLARFYADPRRRGTPYFRPRRAAEMFRQIRDGPAEQAAHNAAIAMLQRMRKAGSIE